MVHIAHLRLLRRPGARVVTDTFTNPAVHLTSSADLARA